MKQNKLYGEAHISESLLEQGGGVGGRSQNLLEKQSGNIVIHL